MSRTKAKVDMVQQSAPQLDYSRKEIVFFEEDNPRSLVNLLPPVVKQAALAIPTALLSMSSKDLRKKLDPNDLDEQLRLSFWDEYFVSIDNSRMMRIEAVYGRICSKEHFYRNVVHNPNRLAYVLLPPEDYLLKVRGLLELGLNKFAEILQLPLRRNGVVDSKLIGQIVQIVSILDNRVRGAVPQKLLFEGKQMNMNMNVNYEAPKSYEEINKQIKDIEKEILQLQDGNTQELADALFEGENVEGREAPETAPFEAEAIRISSRS